MRPNHLLSLRPAVLVAVALLALATALPAAAQSWLVGARVAYADPSGDAYEAVYDEALTLVGAQLELRWPTWFLRLAAEQGEADGELIAFDIEGIPFPAGITSTLDLRLVHLTAGYHTGLTPWGWYVGGGVTSLDGDEEAFFFSESISGSGFHVLGGVRVALTDRWEVGGELIWWSVSDVFDGGAGVALNDPDLEAIELAAVAGFSF
jgi:hypothetical protein